MADRKSETLAKFDEIIAEFRIILSHKRNEAFDRYTDGYVLPAAQEEALLKLQSCAVALLSRIGSKDGQVQRAISILSEGYTAVSNVEDMLASMISLRADYENGILTKHPRLLEPPILPTARKPWLTEARAIIIAALIGAAVTVVVAYFSYAAGQANAGIRLDNALIITFTPAHAEREDR